MKYAVKVLEQFSKPGYAQINEITPKSVEKAARCLFNIENASEYSFKLSGDHGGFFYCGMHQVRVFIEKLIYFPDVEKAFSSREIFVIFKKNNPTDYYEQELFPSEKAALERINNIEFISPEYRYLYTTLHFVDWADLFAAYIKENTNKNLLE